MVLTMTTRNAGRRTVATRGGGTSEQDGREGERSSDQVGSGRGSQGGGRGGQGSGRGSQGGGQDGQESDQGSQGSSRAQVGNHINNQGNNKNQDDNIINDNNQGNVRTMNNGQGGCSYKEFMACNLKDYDGKGGAILARLVPYLVTPENKRIKRYIYGLALQIRAMVAATEPTTIQSVVLKAGMLTNEAIRNGVLKKVTEKRGNSGDPSRDGNVKDDNKRVVNPLNVRNPTAARGARFECGSTDHYKAACPRLNRAPRLRGNRPNQVMDVEGGQGRGNNGNQARGRAFMMGAEEARQDPNIVAGAFTLNNHYATTLFDYGADYSFISTTFIPLLDIEPNNLGFSYEIKIASGQLVEINKVIRGCKLKIQGHTFDIDLIPFGHGSFDVIVGMDWLSRHKTEIVCHEKVVIILLPKGEMLRVLGERPEEKVRHLLSAKAEEQKLKDIVVTRNFSKVFPDDLSGLPPSREIEFRIDLIPGAMPVAKSPYRLAPSEMEELTKEEHEMHLGLILELIKKEKLKIEAVNNWEAPRTPSEKHKEYVWGEEQERAFQTLKDKLCNVPVLALFNGPKDFILKIHEKNYTIHDLELGAVVFALKIWRHYLYGTKSVIYTDYKSLHHIFNQKELNMPQRCWIELFSDYDYEIRYHPCKANVVADALNDQMEHRSDGALYCLDRIWVPLTGDVRTLIMDEAHKSRYSIHLGADKMYYDLRDMYWWTGMKKDMALYVSKCLTCSKIKAEHRRPSSLLQQPKIPEWKWERIAMDFITKLPRTGNGHDAIWVIVDRLTKSAHFLPIREDFKMDRLARLYLNEIISRHGVPILIISDRESRFTSSYHSSVRCAPFEALYGRKCHSPILRAEVGEAQLIGPEIVQETTEKISHIKDRLKTVRDRQKSYADKRRKPLEFSVGDHVLLKVSPWKGVVRFGKKGKLAPRFVGPFEITERIGPVAYKLRLSQELNGVHDTFHLSNLKKCLADPTLHIPLEEIQVDAKLNFVEEPVEILEREFKKLKQSRIAIVKV
ncbi:putative reverse transcriptase domain-containing protein [Tanacetum coccineum]|uniref:Reverse transcriptase domain-containing protein n=1 Tax=Tanacetum coccineum TaxID=301880 RepID=A0ABQ5GJQ7_9ASTR